MKPIRRIPARVAVIWILAVGIPVALPLPAPAIAVAAGESPDEVFAFARRLQKDGMVEAAAQQFLRFVRENPRDSRAPEALRRAADCLVANDDVGGAVRVLETLTSTFPDHPDRCAHRLRLARLYARLERYADAEREFTTLVVTMPDCPEVPDALLGRGEALISLKEIRRAARVLRNVIDRYPGSAAAPRAAYDLAFCLRRTDRDGAALETYERITRDWPRDPLAGFAALEAARMHAARGDTTDAVAFYERARRFAAAPIAGPAAREGADLLVRSGDAARALAWYEALLARADLEDRREIHVRAVRAALAAHDEDAVYRLADAFESTWPDVFSPQVVEARAMAALRRGDWERARRDADRLERGAPGTAWGQAAHRIRAEALLGQGQARPALEAFDRFVAVSSDSASRCQVLRRVADLAFDAVRDTTRALEALRRLLEVERYALPGEMLDVARRFESVGRYADARAIYADVEARFPLSGEAVRAAARRRWLEDFTVVDAARALRALDRRLEALAAGAAPDPLALARARIEVTKDFEGAVDALERVERSIPAPAKGRWRLLLGRAHAAIARREHGRVNGGEAARKAARRHARRAHEAWEQVVRDAPDSPEAVEAALAAVILDVDLGEPFDARVAVDLANRHPDRPEASRIYAALGDARVERGTPEDFAAAAKWYALALRAGEDADLEIRRADALLRAGDADAAVKILERVARGQGRDALRAAYDAGRAHRELKHYRDAVRYFDRVAVADPEGRWGIHAAIQAADCFFLAGRYDEALRRYDAMAARARDADTRWTIDERRARCRARTGEVHGALAAMLACLDRPGGTPAQRLTLARAAARLAAELGDARAEHAVLARAFETFGVEGGAADLASRWVRVALRDGDVDAALTAARRLVASRPDDADARGLLAMALYRAGRPKEADRERRRVEQAAGGDSDIVREIGVARARVAYDAGRYAEAAAALAPYAESCRGGGACEDARFLHAMSLLGARDLERGSAAARAFFRDYPVSPRAARLHLRLGGVLTAVGRVTEAAIHFGEAADAASADSATAYTALRNLAVAEQKLERWKDAEAAWQRLLERFPDADEAPEAALNVARCRMEQGDYQGAIRAYTEAIPILDDAARARAYYWMGQSHEQLGDWRAAVVDYLRVPYLASGSGMWVVTARLKAAECYRKLGRNRAAREIYEKVLRTHGAASNWGRLARKALDALDAEAARGRDAGRDEEGADAPDDRGGGSGGGGGR